MKIRSRGLGRRELEMNLREFTLERDGRGILLKGVTHAPITWETTIRIGPRDVGGILRFALRPGMLRLGLAWALHRDDVAPPDGAGPPERLPRRRAAAADPRAADPRAADTGVAGPAPSGTAPSSSGASPAGGS